MSKRYSEDSLTTRAFNATFRAVDNEAGVIEGTPIVFNQDTVIQDWAGQFVERIDPKALDKADMRDVLLFVNHDTNKIALARSKNGNENSTMKFSVDNEGVHMRAILDTENNFEARAVHSAVTRGDMDGMSFMFRVAKDEWRNMDSELPTRIIKEISIIHEVSVVNFPAYKQTSVSARGQGETCSILEEARRKHAEETVNDVMDVVELEKLKNVNIMRLF